jgi:UDP-N-acetylmuramate dehydrogenase
MPDSAAFTVALTRSFGDRFRRDEPLAGHVTARIGGPADIWLSVKSIEELVTAITLTRHYGLPFFILGGGANLLISDAGIRGVVVQNQAGQVWFPARATKAGETALMRVAGGVILPNLVRRCVTRGLSGLEWAVGVPGTIGGAVVNNAGAYGSNMAENLGRVELLSPQNERQWYPTEWMEYEYRTSRLKKTGGIGVDCVTCRAKHDNRTTGRSSGSGAAV